MRATSALLVSGGGNNTAPTLTAPCPVIQRNHYPPRAILYKVKYCRTDSAHGYAPARARRVRENGGPDGGARERRDHRQWSSGLHSRAVYSARRPAPARRRGL